MVGVLGLVAGQGQAQFADRELDRLGLRVLAQRPAVERQWPVHSVDDDAPRPLAQIVEPVLRDEAAELGAERRRR